MKKQFTVRLLKYEGKTASKRYIRVNIPLGIADMFGLQNDDLMIVEPDSALGFIKLIPAKIVPKVGISHD